MRRLTHALILACALFTLTAMVPEAQAAVSGDNMIRYIPEEDWSNTTLSMEEKEEKAHEVHWLTGVNPPVMPHELEKRNEETVGVFTLVENKNDRGEVTHRYYASPYYPGNGWYDMNKYVSEVGSGKDSHLCFAVSMTNMIHWWMEQNQEHIEHYIDQLPPEQAEKKAALTNYLHNHLKDGSQNQPVLQNAATSRLYNDVILPAYTGASEGGWPDKPADYFFNGYLPEKDKMERNRPEAFPVAPHAPGGLFYDVFGRSILTDNVQSGNYETLNQVMGDYMDRGIGVVIGFNIMGGSHAIALWGVEYDETGKLCAMYLVDNNDNGVQTGNYINGELEAMIRYEVIKSASGPAAYITTQADNSARDGRTFINSYYPLTLAEDGWEAWEKTGKPIYGDGRALLNPIRDTIVCNHTYSYAVQGSRIVRTCTQCGLQDWVGIRLRNNDPIVYDGTSQKPCVMQSSLGNRYPFTPNGITYINNRDAGTATAKMSFRTGDKIYTARLEFTIQPKPSDAPNDAPELLSVTPYTAAVKAVPGLEYSIDGETWTAEGRFEGLKPDTIYEISVRTAAPEDTNYTHSVPGAHTLSVRTAKEEPVPLNWSVDSLGDGQVTVVNHGKRDTAQLVIAGYNERGQQTFVKMKSVTAESGQALTVSFSDNSIRYRAFLVNTRFIPVSQIASTV